MMWHPSHNVLDLDEAEECYKRLFGADSTNIEVMMNRAPPREGFSRNYSTFTFIQDVLFDTIQPTRYIAHGRQRYPTPEKPHLNRTSWYVEGNGADLYRAIRGQGIRFTNQADEISDADEIPGPFGPGPLYTLAEDAGLLYSLLPAGPFPLDPRTKADWVRPPAGDNPLGIEFCSHHTVLTSDPDRAQRLMVNALGGTLISEGRDELRTAAGPYVHLADSTLHFAVPDAGSPAETELAGFLPKDCYHALTWKVTDLGQVAQHLDKIGVQTLARSDDTIITNPETSLGIPWGFTTALTPGDPRA
jgi:hypothetical protein